MCTVNRDSFRDQVKSLIREGMAQPGSTELGDVTMDMGTPDVCHVAALTTIAVLTLLIILCRYHSMERRYQKLKSYPLIHIPQL
jgi:hypothetical protein